jgi:DNA-binding NarL/FixJ family response regulator
MPARVLIVDDHERFRRTARRMLEADGWDVVGEAADGQGALVAATTIGPDVVLLDVGLPDISGLEVARQLADQLPSLAIVVISTHDSADYRDLALANGARGFLPKTALTGQALDAVLVAQA